MFDWRHSGSFVDYVCLGNRSVMSIQVDNVTVNFRHSPAIHHIDITFNANEMWAILGPNGAGKSTLLKTIMGLIKPDSGKIHWYNLRRSDIAYLPQQSDIDRSHPMSVFELTAMGLWYEIGFFKAINDILKQRIHAVLDLVGMSNFINRPIAQLSNGQFQRVLLARMLVQNAKVLLLDEPFNAVDAATTCALLDIIKAYQHSQQCTVITVLHDYQQVQSYFPLSLLLARKVVAAGNTNEVLTDKYLQQAITTMQQREQNQWCNK